MKELPQLFENNKEWIQSKLSNDPNYFINLSKGQSPKYLWIGCSDSRIPAEQVVGLKPGELFVHRNIANLCIHTDFSFLSVLEYAVIQLKVEHVIVCGHYGCGGVNAALSKSSFGLVDNWLRNIKDVYALHKDELNLLPQEKVKKRLVELNVIEQVKNVCHTSIVQNAWQQKKHLCVHGWVYSIETGKLIDLNCSYTKIEQLEENYKTFI